MIRASILHQPPPVCGILCAVSKPTEIAVSKEEIASFLILSEKRHVSSAYLYFMVPYMTGGMWLILDLWILNCHIAKQPQQIVVVKQLLGDIHPRG